jgi:hypothetical protein
MKVHIVTAFDAEPYEHRSWVHKVFFSSTEAVEYVASCHNKVFDEDMDNFDYGYMVGGTITTKEVL